MPAAPPSGGGGNTAVIAAVVIVIVVFVIVVMVIVVVILVVWRKSKGLSKKGIYSPRHFAEQSNTVPTDTLELKYSSPTHIHMGEESGLFSAAAVEKEAEAKMEPDPVDVPVPPVAATPTEGECHLVGCPPPGRELGVSVQW